MPTVVELRATLAAKGLPTDGLKADLEARLGKAEKAEARKAAKAAAKAKEVKAAVADPEPQAAPEVPGKKPMTRIVTPPVVLGKATEPEVVQRLHKVEAPEEPEFKAKKVTGAAYFQAKPPHHKGLVLRVEASAGDRMNVAIPAKGCVAVTDKAVIGHLRGNIDVQETDHAGKAIE